MKVAVVEEREVGGTCLNRGCIPTKTLLHTAKLLQECRHFAEVGLTAGEVSVDMPALIARKEAVSAQLRGGIEQLFKGNKITLVNGRAVLCGEPSGPGQRRRGAGRGAYPHCSRFCTG